MLSWIKKHYFWIIVLVLMIQTTMYGGIANTSASIFKVPVTSDLNMDLATFSLATSMRTLVLFVAMTFSGPVFKRFGTKIPMIAGLGILALAYALLSVSNSFWPMAFSFGLTGLGEAFVGTAAISRIVNAWFHRYQGSVLGLVTACTGLGGGLFSPFFEFFIQKFGWHNARLISAAFLFGAMLCVLFFLYNKPSDLRTTPFGEGYVPKKKEHRRESDHWEGFSMEQLMRRPSFYIAVLAFFLTGIAVYSAFSNIPSHLNDRGLSQYGGMMNGLMLICLAVFKFVCGNISDIIGPKKISIICLSCAAVGLFLLSAVNSIFGFVIAIIIYSISVPMTLVVISLVTYPLFGYRSHDATMGIFLAMPYLGSVIINPVTDAVHDHLGSYDLMFYLSAGLSLIVIALLVLLFVLARADQIKYLQASCPERDDK
jgi:MFS family permease